MAAVGLRPVLVRDVTSISLWSFTTFRRDLADPPAIPTRAVTWYVGEREGVSIVVRPTLLSPTAIFTTVVAEIDPPLFAGLRLYPRRLIPIFGALPDPRIGTPDFDRRFVVQSYDPKRVAALFADSNIATTLLRERQAWPIVIRDRFIEVFESGLNPVEKRLEEQLDVGVALARMIASRSSELPERTEESAARESWASYAFSVPLSFDRRRWRLWGQLHGLEVEACLDGTPPSVITTLRVVFAHPLNCGLYIRRGVYVKTGFFSRTNKPGYKELDHLLLIDAQDNNKRRALLDDVTLRTKIADEASISSLVITDLAITTTHASFLTGAQIAMRFEALVAIAHRLAPARSPMGPFR